MPLALSGIVEAMVCCVAYYETFRNLLRQERAARRNQTDAIKVNNMFWASGPDRSRRVVFRCAGSAVCGKHAVFPAPGGGEIAPGPENASAGIFPADDSDLPAKSTARPTASYKEHGALRMLTVKVAIKIRAPRHGRGAHMEGGLAIAPINVNARCAVSCAPLQLIAKRVERRIADNILLMIERLVMKLCRKTRFYACRAAAGGKLAVLACGVHGAR